MKKTLLVVFLLLRFSINAQPPVTMPSMEICDVNNFGFGEFDLTSQIPAILNGLNPGTTTVTFHETQAGAQTGTDAIVNPNFYVNISPLVQTIFIRVVDTNTSDVYFSSIDLIVNPLPISNPAVLTFCDPTELALYDLNQATNQILAGATGNTVSYHETLTDAQIGANPLPPIYAPITPGQQILFARVQNNFTGCFSITTLTLETNTCNTTCPAPTNLAATVIGQNFASFSWNSSGMVTVWEVLVLPLGVPTPLPNTTGFVVTQTNPFVFTGLSPNTCYSFYVRTVCNPSPSPTRSAWSGPLDFCTSDCTNSGQCPDSLVLNAFVDENNNGIKDTGEINFNYGSFVYQINDSGTNQYGASNNGSYYIFDPNPANSYDFSFAVDSALGSYYTSSVSHNNITVAAGSGTNFRYFPVLSITPHVDVAAMLTPVGLPRPGFQHSNRITYQNLGSQTIPSGTLTYSHQSNVSIVSISQAGTTPTASGFSYNFTNLAPFEIRYIQVNLQVPTIPSVTLGDLITNTVMVQANNDINLSNDSATLTQTIVGSYDPNDKSESHGGKIVHGNFTSGDYLYYTIQFENTGTANAEFVTIVDVLDSQLDETTFEQLTASHAVNTRREGNQLTWHFYDIDLPPTVANPTGSHGYVTFRIKPKAGYAIGDIIPNTASIYFDYNPAIVTNTYATEFVQSMGIGTFNAHAISMVPNPASTWITINNNNAEKISKVVIYDISGKRVLSLNNSALNSINVDVSPLLKGIYLVEVSSETNLKTSKKLILN